MRTSDYIDNNYGLMGSKSGEVDCWIRQARYDEFWKLLKCLEDKYPDKNEFRKNINNLIEKSGTVCDKTSPFYFENLRQKWKIMNLEKCDFKDKQIGAINWLRECVNTDNNKHNNFYFEISRFNREEVREIIFESKDNRLRDYFKEKIGLIYTHFLIDWFLKRYDLPIAFRIIKQMPKNVTVFENLDKLPVKTFFIALSIFATFFLWFFFWHSSIEKLELWKVVELSGEINVIRIFQTIPLFVFIPSGWKYMKDHYWMFRLILPRLFGGILIGYFLLFVTAEVWEANRMVNRFEGVLIVLAASILSLYYMCIEVRNIVQNKKTAFRRGLRIWLIGMLESFWLGIVMQDIFARTLISGMNEKAMSLFQTMNPVTGLLGGNIYPKLLILYTPLALVIGIFVQILWEDKPITQPL